MAPSPESPSPPSSAGRSARLGQRVGPFQLVERLGLRDDIGLYRATRPASSRAPHTVAIRIAEDVRDERAAAWVWHEYEILRRLDDPRIPKAYGYYSSQVGLALSLPPPMTLADVIEARREGRIPVDASTAVDILVELSQALRHIHAIAGPDGPICHGNLSPETVGLTSTGEVVLLGLGAPPRPVSLGYRPPEQVAGAFTDARSDQWRLGALMVELLLGGQLYAGLDDPEAAASTGQVGPWVSRLERRHPIVARIAAKLLAPAAGNRYGTDNLLVRDILEASRRLGGSPDRRALASRMTAIRDAAARRAAEAATTLEDPQLIDAPSQPVRVHHVTRDAEPADPVLATPELTAAEPSYPEPTPISVQPPVAADPPRPSEPSLPEVPASVAAAVPASVVAPASEAELPEVDEPQPAVVAVEVDVDEPSLGLGRVAVADSEDDGPSLGSNLPGLPHTEDPFNDPLGLPIGSPGLTHAAIDPPDDSDAAEATDEDAEASVDEAAEEVEATEVVDRGPPAGPAALRPNKWFPSELAAMAAVGVAAITAIAFLFWRFG